MYESLFTVMRDSSLPAGWSRGVELSRTARVVKVSASADEVALKVIVERRPIAFQVTLWTEDNAWSCDCDESADPCTHAIASLLALRSGKCEEAAPEPDAPAQTLTAAGARLVYAFERSEGRLRVFRMLESGAKRLRLPGTLLGYVGGVSSGRIKGLQVGATKKDLSLDPLFRDIKDGLPDRETLEGLFRQLAAAPNVELDRRPVRLRLETVKGALVVTDSGDGILVRWDLPKEIEETFRNGIVRIADALHLMEQPAVEESERRYLSPDGVVLRGNEIFHFASTVLPKLSQRLSTDIRAKRLPEVRAGKPRIVIDTLLGDEGATLFATPRLIYEEGENEVSLSGGELVSASGRLRVVPVRDLSEEQRLTRDLRLELNLQLDRMMRLDAAEAAAFVRKLRGWTLRGEGAEAFSVLGRLEIQPAFDGLSFEISGQLAHGERSMKRATFPAIIDAWRKGESTVKLVGGGFGVLPKEWLERYGNRLLAIYHARTESGEIPRVLLPGVASLFDELEVSLPSALSEMRRKLEERSELSRELRLPDGFTGELRSYQREGVAWLASMSDLGFGALLADDMGLGKTVQTVAAVTPGTLIVAPTSVIHAWTDHLRRFRPDLSVNLYRGSGRALDGNADVTVTSYGLLRLDADELLQKHWQCVVLDEAQAIKNAQSQTAQAAHRLKAQTRIALTGTPVENHLGELWSLFLYLNPGLLGTVTEFQERFVQPIAKGDSSMREELAARLRPFILRRTKQQVAPELPPKTDVVVTCELNTEERSLYDALLLSTRKEVVALLEKGGTVFSALEQLLRLRQLCCHAALVPGSGYRGVSSKLSLLTELLQCAIDEGHRALVFSQWTSLLDFVEPELERIGVPFVRLDGGTTDREGVVAQFQLDGGPPVMLLSLKAGGTGLTLTAADHVFLLDPWWNPAVEKQAADRAHRIGQSKPVMVYRIITENSIEEKIAELQESKRELLDAVLEGTGAASSLSKEDLLKLLEI